VCYIAVLIFKHNNIKVIIYQKGTIRMRLPYGYAQSGTNQFIINQQQAGVVKSIYDLYLQGKSLGGIVDVLKVQNIQSPTGNLIWTRATIDKILSNGRYIPSIISEEQFWKVQIEKERRSNIDDNGRKTSRYNSQNVLGGLLVCGECGANYRCTTRPSGEVVWRCADKVENGKQSKCSNTMTVSGEKIEKVICEKLDMNFYNENTVMDMIDTIAINQKGIIEISRTRLNFTHEQMTESILNICSARGIM
jgi:hypothetical protein